MKKLTFCKRGHERTPENLYFNGNCKKCAILRREAIPRDDQGKTAQNRSDKQNVDEITDRYVAHCLCISVEELRDNPLVLKLGRKNIRLKRRVEELENLVKKLGGGAEL